MRRSPEELATCFRPYRIDERPERRAPRGAGPRPADRAALPRARNGRRRQRHRLPRPRRRGARPVRTRARCSQSPRRLGVGTMFEPLAAAAVHRCRRRGGPQRARDRGSSSWRCSSTGRPASTGPSTSTRGASARCRSTWHSATTCPCCWYRSVTGEDRPTAAPAASAAAATGTTAVTSYVGFAVRFVTRTAPRRRRCRTRPPGHCRRAVGAMFEWRDPLPGLRYRGSATSATRARSSARSSSTSKLGPTPTRLRRVIGSRAGVIGGRAAVDGGSPRPARSARRRRRPRRIDLPLVDVGADDRRQTARCGAAGVDLDELARRHGTPLHVGARRSARRQRDRAPSLPTTAPTSSTRTRRTPCRPCCAGCTATASAPR